MEGSSAFTLVELLVVISVIGILASLLLGSIGRARVAGDTAGCISNLRQFGIASRMYLDEFRAYPAGTSVVGQIILLEPYLNARMPNSKGSRYLPDRSVWICPAYHRLGLVTDHAIYAYSYGYNNKGYQSIAPINTDQGLASDNGSGPSYGDAYGRTHHPIAEEDVLILGEMIEFGDSPVHLDVKVPSGGATDAPTKQIIGVDNLDYGLYASWGNYDILSGLTDEPPSQPLYPINSNGSYDPFITQLYRQRHGGRWNIGFCDGHVERKRPQDVFDTTKDEQMQLWNRDHQPHRQW